MRPGAGAATVVAALLAVPACDDDGDGNATLRPVLEDIAPARRHELTPVLFATAAAGDPVARSLVDRLADEDWQGLAPPTRILGSNVAGDAVRRRVEEQMEHWDLSARWVVPAAETAGVDAGCAAVCAATGAKSPSRWLRQPNPGTACPQVLQPLACVKEMHIPNYPEGDLARSRLSSGTSGPPPLRSNATIRVSANKSRV